MLHTGRSSEHSGNQGTYILRIITSHNNCVLHTGQSSEHSGNQGMYWEL